MKNEFESWMIRYEGKKQNTAYQYKMSIDRISDHYSQMNNKHIDIYNTQDIKFIKDIEKDYGIGGKYATFGNGGNGTIRNALSTYVRFLEYKKMRTDNSETEPSEELAVFPDENNYNFTYERDLKNSMISQVEQLFPEFKIYGNNREGVEYSIEGKRIDLLLENKEKNILKAIELKAGAVDFHVLGQISMYLGFLSKKFPDKTIKGAIIAGDIDNSLINACSITDKIELMKYQMKLTLEEIKINH